MSMVARDLTVERLGRTVLRSVSLRIEPGECVSVIGPNGAGKSTLMATLLGFLPRVAGTVQIDGAPIESLTRREVARRVAYVPQIQEGYLGYRVREVVEGARYAHLKPLEPLGPDDHAAVRAAVEATRLEPLWERTVDTLSGGERQKVWIASALAQASPALFLDEPTTALDPAHQAELIHIMRGALTAGRTLLVICHDLNLPLVLGGRVIALRDGRVMFDEPVEALRDTQRLEALYGTRFALHRDKLGKLSLQLELDP